jgi:hypothetical protein
MHDIVDFDIGRRWIEQVEAAAGQHALPGARAACGRVSFCHDPVP